MTFEIETPVSEAALWDLLHKKFGLGDWDEDSTTPWWKARANEIGKLKGQMRRRRLSLWDLAVAAWFAEEQNRPITAVYQLCGMAGEARRAYWVKRKAEEKDDLREELEKAAAEAMEQGRPEWADRLYNADRESAPKVLAQWRLWMGGIL